MTNLFKISLAGTLAIAVAATLLFASYTLVSAGHNGAVVNTETGACGETTISATVADPEGTHLVSNMFLVVHANGETVAKRIPIDGTSTSTTVGPFFTSGAGTETIMWHVFGGAERSYDQPLWNGFGSPTFNQDVTDYANEVGTFNWVIAGPDDPNPFVTWNELEVDTCALTKEMCKDGGWADHGFRNQGQCIRFVNTGQDSR